MDLHQRNFHRIVQSTNFCQNETFAVPYGTEASHFEAAGSSTVVIGPGSIDQAHQPNEFVEIAELEKCLGFLEKVADWAESTKPGEA